MNSKIKVLLFCIQLIVSTSFAQQIEFVRSYFRKGINDYDNGIDENAFKLYINSQNVLFSTAIKNCQLTPNFCFNIPVLGEYCLCKNGYPGNLSDSDPPRTELSSVFQ